MSRTLPLRPDEHVNWKASVPFLLFHLVPLAAFYTGVSKAALALGVASYLVRMFFITAGYHRYFSHRSFKAPRAVVFLLGLGGTSCLQKGPLWWASHHRLHHRETDNEADVHSPLKGFWHSHVGWILSDRHKKTDLGMVKDLAKFPELRFIDRFEWMAPLTLAIASYFIAGLSGLVVGFFCSTILLWHGTFTVNSVAHVFGKRRYATTDTSRNSALVALITLGEGWHNNHHHHQVSARQGFFWWEYDPTFYVLKAMSLVGLVSDLRVPTAEVKAGARLKSGYLDVGMVRSHWTKASAALAASKASVSHLPSKVSDTRHHVGDALHARREAVEAKLSEERAALEHQLGAALASVESYGRTLHAGGRIRPQE